MILAFVIAVLLIYCYYREKEHNRHIETQQQERKDLLDRIQAGTFKEYTAKVITEKKIEQKPEEPKVIDDYIS